MWAHYVLKPSLELVCSVAWGHSLVQQCFKENYLITAYCGIVFLLNVQAEDKQMHVI